MTAARVGLPCIVCGNPAFDAEANYVVAGLAIHTYPCVKCGEPGDVWAPGLREEQSLTTIFVPNGPELVVKARELATVAHAGQMYGRTGKPYTYHLEIVARYLERRYPDDYELHAMGWLHDSVEDDGLTFDLIERECGTRVKNGVLRVSHLPKDTPYPLYIASILPDYDACRVKWADMEHNSRGQTDHPKYGPFLPMLRKQVVLHEARLREESFDSSQQDG